CFGKTFRLRRFRSNFPLDSAKHGMEYRELHYADAPDPAVSVDLRGLNHDKHRVRIIDVWNEAGLAGISIPQPRSIELKRKKIRPRVITPHSDMAAGIRRL